MTKLTVSNSALYGDSKTIYVTSGDHNLVEITGDDVGVVEVIIKEILSHPSRDEVFEKIKDQIDNDKDYYDGIIEWLISSNIVEETQPISCVPQVMNTHIFSPYLTLASQQQALADIDTELIKYTLTDINSASLIIVFAPIFEFFEEVARINAFAYKHGVTICHVGMDRSTFTLGPICEPKINSPCLVCYAKRKLSNLKNPQKTLSFVKHANKEIANHYNLQSNQYFKIALHYLKTELEKFTLTKGSISAIIGKSLVFDNIYYNISKSKILRLPGCPACNAEEHFSPLNA